MAKLEEVIAAFLADLTRAQDGANELSKRMSERYRTDKLLRFFPVPNALLEEAEVELRFGVLEPELSGERLEGSNGMPPMQPSASAVRELVRRVARTLAGELRREALSAQVPERELQTRVAEALASNRVEQALADHLHARLDEALSAGRAESALLDADENRPSAPAPELFEELKRSASQALSADPDLGRVLGDVEAAVARSVDAQRERIARELTGFDARLQRLEAARSLPSSMNVTVDAERLQNFPDHAVHSIKLKARLRNYQWVIVKDGEEALVPSA